jgi:hypothetical protein
MAALAVIMAALGLYAWAGPEATQGSFASSAPRQRSNCPPRRYYASQSPRPAAPEGERVEPEYPQTSARGNSTTAFRRSD